MNAVLDALAPLVGAILISGFTAWITVQLALRQFYSQKWWERKADAYSQVIEALYHVKNTIRTFLAAEEEGWAMPAERRKALEGKLRDSYQQIFKAEGMGAFIISDHAASILTELRTFVANPTPNSSLYDTLDSSLSAVNTCLDKLREEAKRDLKIR